MLLYIAALMLPLAIAAYGVLLFLSHTPRLPIASESRYTTNDTNGEEFDLPPRVTTDNTRALDDIDISVIVPCYNEVKRLKKMMDEAVAYLEKTHRGKYEIILVDDGSTDGTAKYGIELANMYNLKPHIVKVVHLAKNRGKGGAVTHGMLHALGKYALFADADGATQFSDISKLLDFLEKHQEEPAMAIGSRAHLVNTDAVVKRSFIRNFLMYGLHTLVYIFGIRAVKDTQCGFKMFNQEAVAKIFPHMHTERWIFDVEVLLLGAMQGVLIEETSVNWQEVDGSKVDLARDSIEMAVDLVVTRLAYILGIYKLNECGRANKKDQ
ncbi:glycosyltransferase family 2 protein [Acetobacter pasteurianus]|nr:glycosyltransferase family 2 protein [Acetobacter pasteurianus]